jgi:polar amino acid transport system permease protein
VHRRRWFASIALFAALLALTMAALVPGAFAQIPSPGGAPTGTPEITGTIPNPNDPKGLENWTGNRVLVNYRANGAELDLEACRIFIDGSEEELSAPPNIVPAVSRATSTLQFRLAETYPAGDYVFRVLLVTTTGEEVEHTWAFGSRGAAGASAGLVSTEVMRDWFWYIAEGAVATVELTVVSIVLASALALLGSLGRLSRKMSFRQGWDRYHSWPFMGRLAISRIPYWIATFYTSLFRGTPLLLQIVAIYQVIPEVINYFGLPASYNPSPFWAGVAALSLNYGAYLTEVFRAGIQAVPKGQHEAAWAIGLSGWQTQRRIVLPQAFKIVIPAVGNDFIALIKDTSLVSVITVEELLRRSQLAGAATFSFFSTLLVAAGFYWALTIFFSFWQAKLETRMARDKAREKEKAR